MQQINLYVIHQTHIKLYYVQIIKYLHKILGGKKTPRYLNLSQSLAN